MNPRAICPACGASVPLHGPRWSDRRIGHHYQRGAKAVWCPAGRSIVDASALVGRRETTEAARARAALAAARAVEGTVGE